MVTKKGSMLDEQNKKGQVLFQRLAPARGSTSPKWSGSKRSESQGQTRGESFGTLSLHAQCQIIYRGETRVRDRHRETETDDRDRDRLHQLSPGGGEEATEV